MEIKLNIYNGKEIEKTYTVNEFDIMFGTIEDLINVLDVDKLTGAKDDTALLGAVAGLLKDGIGQIKDLLKQVFPGLTDAELKRTKSKELVRCIVDIVKFSFAEITGVATSKN